MEIDPSIRNADGPVIAAMVIVLAGIVGVIGFSMGVRDVDVATDQTVRPAVVAAVSTAKQVATGAIEVRVKPFEETWNADESSRGTRPDASH